MPRQRSSARAPEVEVEVEALKNLPKPILDKLRALIRRVRRVQVIRGGFATLAAGALAIAESGAAHYVVEQSAGDVLWVPTWCWHRVDYQARAWRRDPTLRVPGAT